MLPQVGTRTRREKPARKEMGRGAYNSDLTSSVEQKQTSGQVSQHHGHNSNDLRIRMIENPFSRLRCE